MPTDPDAKSILGCYFLAALAQRKQGPPTGSLVLRKVSFRRLGRTMRNTVIPCTVRSTNISAL